MSSPLPADFCPYRGLQPYTDRDRDFFFGRERDREIIASNLYASPLTVLYGASGVGKTSVLMAGVVPRLRVTSRVAIVVFREWQDPGFLQALKQAIARAAGKGAGVDLSASAEAPLDECIQQCATALRGPVFVVLDQFEEYFLYHPASAENVFDAEFARAVNRREVHAGFLVSMREDELSKLDRFEARIPNLLGNLLRLEHLSTEGAVDAIRKPLERYNTLVPAAARVSIDDGLVEQVLREEVRFEQAGQGQPSMAEHVAETSPRIETPFLQMVLVRVWHAERDAGSSRLRLETLRTLGGANGIVREHLDSALASLSDEHRDIAGRVFHHLVTPSGTKIAYLCQDLAMYADLQPEQVEPLLKALSDPSRRILRPVAPPTGRGGGSRYEIFHDALAPAILDWRRRYVAQQEKVEAERSRLEIEEEQSRRQRTRARRMLTAIAGMAVALAVVVVLFLFAINQRGKAMAQSKLADSARAVAVGARLVADSLRVEAQLAAASAAAGRDTAILLRKAAEVGRKAAILSDSRELAALAWRHLSEDPVEALQIAVRAMSTAPTDEAVTALRLALGVPAPPFLLGEHQGGVTDVTFSPDGRIVVTAGRDGSLRILDAGTGAIRRTIEAQDAKVRSVLFSPDGTTFATRGLDSTVRIWDVETGSQLSELRGHANSVAALAFSLDGGRMATGSEDSTARVWEVRSGKPLRTFMGHAGGVHAVAFSPDGKRLVTEAADNSGRIWDLEGSAEPRVLSDLSGPHAAIAFSPDGEWLVTEAGPTTAKVWSVNDPADTVRLTGHDGGLTKVSFNSDGTHILTASDDGTARVWRIGRSGGRRIVAPLAVLRGHKGSISTAAFTAGDQYVLTAGVDGTARLWDFDKEKEPVAVLRGHSHGILAASMSPDGTRIATASTDGKSRIWELIARSRAVVMNDSPDAGPGGTAGRTSGGPPAVTWQVAALTPGGEFLLGLRNGRPGLWRTSTGAARQIPTPTTVRAAVSSADGSLVAIAPRLSRIQIWDAASGQVIREVGVARPSTQLSVLAFSPSGKLLATRQTADLTRVWEVTSGREVATIPTDSGAVASSPMAFSPDDKLLVLSSRKRGATREQITASAQVWNLERRARVTELRGFLSTVLSLSFSADGRTILSASGDTVARVWNARTGQVLRKVRSKSEVIDFASPSPHGEVLLTVAYGHSVRLWEASTGTLLTEIHGLRADLMRATFGPDGRIVTVERGGTVRFVDCDVCGGPRELLAKASARLKRVEAAPAPVVASGQPPRR